jgi:1-pyrroline-5-carboxylate dehydrogenase
MNLEEFHNEPATDFLRAENRAAMEVALKAVASRLGQSRTMQIDGREVSHELTFASHNPSHPSEIVGVFPKATPEDVASAVNAAARAFETWRLVSAEERSAYLFRAAEIMRQRRHELSAWLSYEVGKTWPEADADTAEAIDFLEFYGRENLRYSGEHPCTPIPGERTALVYRPLGVCAVIPPWNFPLAILVGMASAAIVTGNTVVLKPSSDAPTIADEFVRIMREVGLPAGVLNFITGRGSEIGDALVTHPLVRLVAFTGSKQVGLRINELAAHVGSGQRWIKRVIAEMGGKDAIIVDRDADLDAAAQGVAASAFGYQGQKCSACSRVIVDQAVYDAFIEKLLTRVRALKVGPATDPSSSMGPVINARARGSILESIETGRREGRVLLGGEKAGDDSGYFVTPTVIADVEPSAHVAQEEIFGPVLAVLRSKDFEDGLRIANDTEYGLTGSVYTRDRAKIERATRDFFVGNLYFNRKCTGAMVGGHPFGGFNMSGTDSKAGGRDYLLLFLQAQAIAEKLA